MKRHLLVLGALVSLTSCIPVEDFGAYWDKAGIDKGLEGSWMRVAASPEQARDSSYGVGTITRFTVKAGAYEMVPVREAAEKKDSPMYPVKTLAVGGYQFLIAGPHKGLILGHYKVTAGTLDICSQDGSYVVEFVQARHPQAVNVGKNRGEGTYLAVQLFDDEVFNILAEIPDQRPYWHCDQKYERVP